MATDETGNPRAQWQNQPSEERPMTLEDIRSKAQRFETRIRRRNAREYVAASLVIVVFGFYVVAFEPLLLRIASALVSAGAMVFFYTLHQRGGVRTLPADLGLTSLREFHRRELERQRDLVLWASRRGFLPFAPGVILFIAGLYVLPRGGVALGTGVAAIITTSVVVVSLLNRRAGRRLQRMIDQLQA